MPYCPGWERRSSAADCLSAEQCAEGQDCLFDFTPVQCPPTGAACPQPCTDDTFCNQGQVCHHPFLREAGRCGCRTFGGTCDVACLDSNDCLAGYVCEAGGHCVPDVCGSDADCGPGMACDAEALDASDRGCRTQRCFEPGAAPCGPNLDCDPTATFGDGCVRRVCTSAADCDCGACAPNGALRTCAFAVGTCGDATPWF